MKKVSNKKLEITNLWISLIVIKDNNKLVITSWTLGKRKEERIEKGAKITQQSNFVNLRQKIIIGTVILDKKI